MAEQWEPVLIKVPSILPKTASCISHQVSHKDDLSGSTGITLKVIHLQPVFAGRHVVSSVK
jgi:hypothetical protein